MSVYHPKRVYYHFGYTMKPLRVIRKEKLITLKMFQYKNYKPLEKMKEEPHGIWKRNRRQKTFYMFRPIWIFCFGFSIISQRAHEDSYTSKRWIKNATENLRANSAVNSMNAYLQSKIDLFSLLSLAKIFFLLRFVALSKVHC